MNRDLSLSEEKRFSFIQTITIYSHHYNNELHQISVNELISVAKTEQDREVSSSSALCIKDNIVSDSSSNANSTSTPNTISDLWYPFNKDETPSVIYVPESTVNAVKKSSKKTGFNCYLDRILLIFARGYLCFVFWWLFASKNALFPLVLSSQGTISRADAEFIDYMKQSLEVIDRVAIKQSSTETAASTDKTSEVVYVPVYTPNSTANSSDRNNLPQPNIQLPPPPPPNNLAALNPPISTIKIQPPIPPSESVEVKTTPAESSSEAETSITKSTPDNTSREIAATTIKPNIEHTLVGLMELKEGSAALFKIGSVTQRIWLGEEIENTGWILDSVANQKAKISYEGKTLTLSVGETFQSNE